MGLLISSTKTKKFSVSVNNHSVSTFIRLFLFLLLSLSLSTSPSLSERFDLTGGFKTKWSQFKKYSLYVDFLQYFIIGRYVVNCPHPLDLILPVERKTLRPSGTHHTSWEDLISRRVYLCRQPGDGLSWVQDCIDERTFLGNLYTNVVDGVW